MEECCVVCAEPLEWVAYGVCGHRDVCSTCVARLRFILNNKNCCICKQECPSVFVTKALGDYTKVVKDFEGLCNRGDLWYEVNIEAYFDDKQHFTLVKAMCRLSCPKCEQAHDSCFGKGRAFDSLDLLRQHISHSHKLQMCSLCLEGRKVFICEQRLYSKAQLECHLAKGDPEVDGVGQERGGFSGHPMCNFCRTRFYGDNELYHHMSVDHYLCHICRRLHPGHYDYFRNYDELEAHFRHEHALCEHRDCLEKKFVVFTSDVELKRHNVSMHGGSMSRSQRHAALQVPISFQFSRPAQGHGPPHNVSLSNSQSNGGTQGGTVPTTSDELHAREPLTPPSAIRSGLNGPDFSDTASDISLLCHSSGYLTAAGGVWPPHLEESAFPPLPGSKSAQRKAKQRARASSKTADGALSNKVCGSSQILRGPDNLSSSSTACVSMPNPWLHSRRTSSDSTVKVIHTASGVHGSKPAHRSDDNSCHEARVNAIHPASTINGQVPPSSNEKLGGSAPVLRYSLEGDPQNSFKLTEEVRFANKALAEHIRFKLGGDKDLFVAFKDLSAQFRVGKIDSSLYCEHIRGFGLWELVPELARLCPDPEKQKSLLRAYERDEEKLGCFVEGDVCQSNGHTDSCVPRMLDKEGISRVGNVTEELPMCKGKQKAEPSASVSSSSVGSCSQNGVYKQPQTLLNWMDVPAVEAAPFCAMETWSCSACTLENDVSDNSCAACETSRLNNDDAAGPTSTTRLESQGKQKKKNSKFERLRLDDVSQQPLLQVKEEPPALSATMQKRAQNRASDGGGRGVWRKGGGQRLVALAHRDAVIESAWK